MEQHETRAIAEAYLKYLYSEEGQEICAEHYYRPRSESVMKKYMSQFPSVALFTIDEVFGGWKQVQEKHFGDGGVFDTIFQAGR